MERESNTLPPSGVRVYVTLASVCMDGKVLHTSEGDVCLAPECEGDLSESDKEFFLFGYLDDKGFHILKILYFDNFPPTEFAPDTQPHLLALLRKK